jgi:FkbM family methyltransferase
MPDFEAMLERFYSKLDLRGSEIVDIGAHTGRHTIPLARLAGMGGRCYAFEPSPTIRARLCENLAAAEINQTVVVPYAVADKDEIAEFNFVPNLPEESGLKKRHIYNAEPSEFKQIPVRVCRLDDALPASRKIRFIKIDVEGGELDVLRGALSVLDSCKPIVAFECGAAGYLGYHEKPDEIFEIFARRNYAVYSIIGVQIKSVDEFREVTSAQNFWDYVAFSEHDRGLAALLTPV